MVGVDADIPGDLHGPAGDFLRRQAVVLDRDQGARGRQGVVAARTDGEHAVGLGLDHVTVARDDQRVFGIDHDQHGFQPAQVAVLPPVLGQFHSGPDQLPGVGFKLGFQPLEQGEGIGGGAGETADHVAALAQTAHFDRAALHHRRAEADLPVTGDHHFVALADRQNGGAVHGIFTTHRIEISSFRVDDCTET